MEIQETNLPGVGKKFKVPLHDQTILVIIIHNTGKREIYLDDDKDMDNKKLFELNDAEARIVGTILEGAYYQPVVATDTKTQIDDNSIIEWYVLEKNNRLIGRTLETINSDQDIDIQIIAFKKEGDPITSSDQKIALNEGDTIITIGSKEQHDQFLNKIKG